MINNISRVMGIRADLKGTIQRKMLGYTLVSLCL
jgi:hypothetical protein